MLVGWSSSRCFFVAGAGLGWAGCAGIISRIRLLRYLQESDNIIVVSFNDVPLYTIYGPKYSSGYGSVESMIVGTRYLCSHGGDVASTEASGSGETGVGL